MSAPLPSCQHTCPHFKSFLSTYLSSLYIESYQANINSNDQTNGVEIFVFCFSLPIAESRCWKHIWNKWKVSKSPTYNSPFVPIFCGMFCIQALMEQLSKWHLQEEPHLTYSSYFWQASSVFLPTCWKVGHFTSYRNANRNRLIICSYGKPGWKRLQT